MPLEEKKTQLSLEELISGRGQSKKSLWVFAEDNIDYITKLDIKECPSFSVVNGQLQVPRQRFVIDYNGQDIMEFDGAAIYENKRKTRLLKGGEKYDTRGTVPIPSGGKGSTPIRIYIERVQMGGGGINMMRAMSQHSKALRKMYTSLHVDNHATAHNSAKLAKIIGKYQRNPTANGFRMVLRETQRFMDYQLLEFALMQMNVEDRLMYISSHQGSEAKNFVIYEVDSGGRATIADKIILRGTKIKKPRARSYNTAPERDLGTIVINSTTSEQVFNEALRHYSMEQKAGHDPLGIICLTEKMELLYQHAQKRALANGFITVLNETEALKYARPNRNKGLDRYGLQLKELFASIKKMWDDQGEKHSRIYVTLGEYGCIGVDEDGTIYRTSVFKFDGTDLNTNGAGDTFLSMVARLEHERRHQGKSRSILETMSVASGTAAYFIENQNAGRTVTETNVKNYLKGKELEYECLDSIESPFVWYANGKISRHPIGPDYKTIVMR